MTYDMQYNINSQITTINDVEAFFQHLVSERSLSFHPDDRFEDYISCDDILRKRVRHLQPTYGRML